MRTSCISHEDTFQSRMKRPRAAVEERERAKEFEKVGKFQLVNPLSFPLVRALLSLLPFSLVHSASFLPSLRPFLAATWISHALFSLRRCLDWKIFHELEPRHFYRQTCFNDSLLLNVCDGWTISVGCVAIDISATADTREKRHRTPSSDTHSLTISIFDLDKRQRNRIFCLLFIFLKGLTLPLDKFQQTKSRKSYVA